mgnify:CR=1 FL=1
MNINEAKWIEEQQANGDSDYIPTINVNNLSRVRFRFLVEGGLHTECVGTLLELSFVETDTFGPPNIQCTFRIVREGPE